jgi:uncharacterized protein YciI
VHFLVLGVDGPRFDAGLETDLHEAHWAYMDERADFLVARGPILTSDGTRHTGSLHVVDLPDLEAADRFAREEPYAQAGWYADVTVSPLDPCVTGTMWDKPLPEAGQRSSLVRARFEARPRGQGLRPVDADPAWLYLGLVLADDARDEIGLVGLVDLAPREAVHRMGEVATANGLSLDYVSGHRWQRGGRHQS